jgi:hypothetical protein
MPWEAFAAFVAAVGGVLLGILTHRRKLHASMIGTQERQLAALTQLYRDLVQDLRAAVDRLRVENRQLRHTVDLLVGRVSQLERAGNGS